MPLRRLTVIGSLTLLLFVPALQPVEAQSSADLFNDGTLHEIRLFINSRDLLRLRSRYLENTYYPADLQWRNTRVRNVGVRSRGTGSRSATKLGLRVDFNRYTRNQRFVGLRSLVLDNLWQDKSLLREPLAMKVFARSGEPAPRESYCRLFVNNVFQGVYAIVEEIDVDFTARTIGENTGYLYEYHYTMPFYAQYLGDALTAYKPLFEPRSHELEPDAILYGPIRELFRAVNQPDDAVWRDDVERRIDLTQLVTHVAIEAFLAENDGILGYAGMNNFYLYRFAGTDRHRLFAWDKDFAMTFLEASVLRSVEENILVSRALAQPDLRARFLDVLEQCARLAADEDWLENEINRLVELIGPAVRQDTLKQYSNTEFDDEVEFLRTFARMRSAFVLDEVGRLR